MNEYSYVYLLLDKSKKKFKIGLTKNILQRYRTLNSIYGEFSVKDSYLIKCEGNYAKKLEKILHFTFSDFNLYINFDSEGHTEWFDVSCLNDLIKFVKEIKKINRNIIEIKQNIQEIEILNESFLHKNEAKKDKKEYRIKQLKKENILKTITFLKTIKKMVKSKKIYKKDNFTLIFENITFFEAKELTDKISFSLSFETETEAGVFGIEDWRPHGFKDNKFYLFFNFDFLYMNQDKEQIKKTYTLMKCFFDKYFGIDINRHSTPLFNIKNNHYILTLSEDIP